MRYIHIYLYICIQTDAMDGAYVLQLSVSHNTALVPSPPEGVVTIEKKKQSAQIHNPFGTGPSTRDALILI